MSDKVVFIREPDLKELHNFEQELKEGTIEDAVLVYRKEDESCFMVLTDSPYESLAWILFKAIIHMIGEEEE